MVGWAGVPKFLRAPRHLGRVLASSCDTGMYFHAPFPTYRYIARAHALQRSHYLTLPRYTRLTYSCPPRPFSPTTRIGERAGATGREGEQQARRPGAGPDQPAPLALPQNQPSTQHPPSSSVLQQSHTCERQHHQRCETASAVPSFPVRLLAATAWLRAPTPVSPCLASQSLLRVFNQVVPHKTGRDKPSVMVKADAHFPRRIHSHVYTCLRQHGRGSIICLF